MKTLVRLYLGLHIVGFLPLLVFILSRRTPGPIKTRGFLVDTPACRIPDIDPLDKSIAKYVRLTGYRLLCRRIPAITHENGDMIIINWAVINATYKGIFKFCKFQPITREPHQSDFHFSFGNLSEPFSKSIKVNDEFLRVYCFSKSGSIIYKNYHAMIIPKESILTKSDEHSQHNRRKNKLKIMNVLMIGVDSISRLNFMRQMPLTRKYLLETMGGIEMKGYTKVADNTLLNVIPLTTGRFMENLPWNEERKHEPFDNYSFIWNNFSRNSYVTLYAEDAPRMSAFTYLKEGFHQPPADHYIRPFGLALEADNSVWNSDHACVGDRLETDIVLKYVRDFASHYQNRPHFGFTFLTRLTHDDANAAGLADYPHFRFLQRIHSEGLLENTILVYFSDHGIRFGTMRRTFVGKLEERMPLLTFVLPKWFAKTYPKFANNMRINSRRLTTPFDVYETLMDIVHFNEDFQESSTIKRGISLFNEIPRGRSCENAAILPHWCMCLEHKVISTSSRQALSAVDTITQHINEELHIYRDLCEPLVIKTVNKAVEMVASDNVLRHINSLHDVINRTVEFGIRTKSVVLIQVTFETAPGGGMFEATVTLDETNNVYSLSGDISRINKYEHQSECADNFKLRKYCVCK